MKKILLTLFGFIFLLSPAFSQNPIIWKKTYNSNLGRSIMDFILTDTSCYILSQTANNVELININKATGNLNFSKTYNGQNIEYPGPMYITNHSIDIFGITSSTEGIYKHNHGNWDIFHLKTDLSGTLIDTNFFGGSLSHRGGVFKLSNNKYICSAKSESIDGDLSFCSSTTNNRSWIFISDSSGNIQKYKCNDTIDVAGKFVFQNGHYYLLTSGTFMQSGGYTYNYPPNSQGNPGGPSPDFLVVEYDTMFNIISVKNYGSDSYESLTSAISTEDNGFMLLGHTDYIHDTLDVSGGIGGRDFYCVKLDSNANLQWSKCFGTMGNDNNGSKIFQTSDHGFLIYASIDEATGNVTNHYGKSDTWLAKIDSVGNFIWERTFGGSNYDYADLIREDSDGSIFITGTTNSTDGTFSGMAIQGQSDIFVIKLAPWVGIKQGEKPKFNITLYPNPTQSGAYINLSGLPVKTMEYQLDIVNLQGQKLYSERFTATYKHKVNLPRLSRGIYFVRLTNDKGEVRNAKFIVN